MFIVIFGVLVLIATSVVYGETKSPWAAAGILLIGILAAIR